MSDELTLEEIFSALGRYAYHFHVSHYEMLKHMLSTIDPIDVLNIVLYLIMPLIGLYKVQQYWMESLKEKNE